MDERIQIWNIFHDGQITVAESEGSGTLTMFVNIPYLRSSLKPLGDSFVVTLSGLSHLEFRDFDGQLSSFVDDLGGGNSLEILSTESDSMPVTINTSLGGLVLDFQGISFALDTGQAVKFDEICEAAEAYWAEFDNRIE